MDRSIKITALLQAFVVIAGFVMVGSVLKFSGYPDDPRWLNWNPVAVFLRHHGVWLLLVPAIWSGLAVRTARGEVSRLSSSTMLLVGIVLSLVLAVLFLYAAFTPYTRPFVLANPTH